MTPLAQLKRTSTRYASATVVLMIGLAALLLLERFGWVATVVSAPVFPWPRLGVSAVTAIPEAIHLAALWWARRALMELADGRLFTEVVVRALQRVGALLLIGSAMAVVLVPSLSAWLGSPPGYLVAYDVSQVVIGALGLVLGLIGRLLQQASAIEAELEGIF